MDDRKFPTEEPNASMRQGAKMVRELFVALVQEGFTERQALSLVRDILQASIESATEQES